MARTTAALNGVALDVRGGSLYEPVAGERFDLVVSNPPFVVSPPGGERLVYRDSGLPGDDVVRRVVTEAPRHLAPGGVAQVLANWVHVAGQPWEERLGRVGGAAPAATRGWCSARSPTPRSTSSCGCATPGSTAGPTTSSATTPGWRGSPSRASRGSGSAG